jgi:hypothetical protein
MNNLNTSNQHGAALVISLIILMVMAILGVSALANTNLEERMTQNYEHTNIAFQAVESSIEKIIVKGDAGGAGQYANPFYDDANDPLKIALIAGINDASTVVNFDMDPDGFLENTALTTSSAIVYTQDGYCPGISTDVAICFYYDVTATGNIAATNTKVTHVQGLRRPAPCPNCS